MTNIDRRRLISSIGALAACTAVAPAAGGTGATLKTRFRDEKAEHYGWNIARQRLAHPVAPSQLIRQNVVDFWSKPLSAISLIDYLPSDISKGVLWFDGFRLKKTIAERLKYIDSVHLEHNFEWIEEPRSVVTCLNNTELLTSTLQSVIADNRSAHALLRTVLLHLGSTSPASNEPEWAQIIPAFARCYNRIIGYYDMQERGLHHHRAWSDDHDNCSGLDASYFKQAIYDPATLCDAVIFTSPALIETDPGLCTSASTKTMAGELIRRLGYAALDRGVVNEIVGSQDDRMKRRPRLFALASVTTKDWHRFSEILEILERQRRLVSASFGELALGRKPIVVAITASQDREKLRRHLVYDRLDPYSKWRKEEDPKAAHSFFEVQDPTFQSTPKGSLSDETLKLISLWPFKFDAVEEKIGCIS